MPPRRRWRRWGVYAGVAAIAVALAATDWPLPVLSSFWRDHAMLGALVSGAALLLVALVLVESWIERQDAARWRTVARVGFDGLANAAMDRHRTLLMLVDGFRFEHTARPPLPRELQQRVAAYFDKAPVHVDESVGVGERARRLSADRGWRDIAYVALAHVESADREAIARWAPVMLLTDDLAELINRVSEAADNFVRDLRVPLIKPFFSGERPSSGWMDRFAHSWQEAFFEATFVQENLGRLAGDPAYTATLPRSQLTSHELARLRAKHADFKTPDPEDPS